MNFITQEQFLTTTKKVFYKVKFGKINLKNGDISNTKFFYCDVSAINFENCNMTNCTFENCKFDGTTLEGATLANANLVASSIRNCNLKNCNIKGANLYAAVLENSNLEGIIFDDKTQYFKLYCPEQGAFLGCKKCLDNRLVTLLIPQEAKRTSSTLRTCRTNKTKVLKITDFTEQQQFTEAWSFVDDNFAYRVGEWLEIKNFNDDRWFDSTTGIHF